MTSIRAGDGDFAWGSEVEDSDLGLDDDGNVLDSEDVEGEEDGSGSFFEPEEELDGAAFGEVEEERMGVEEGEEEEDDDDEDAPPAFAAAGVGLAGLPDEDGWVEKLIERGGALPNEAHRPKTSFTQGMPVQMKDLSSPSDFVLRFLRESFFQQLWQHSLAHQREDNAHPRDKGAPPIQLREIYIFFGILDAMAVRGSRAAKYDF